MAAGTHYDLKPDYKPEEFSFPHSILVNDRFHVQQLFNEAMDDVRIDIRHEVRRQEAAEQELCRENGVDFIPMKYKNKETPKIR